MKKRILSVLLAAFLALPIFVFTGCSESDSTVNITRNNGNALTVTLYSITDKKTDPKAVQAVENELNRITEYEFNTHIILRLYTEDEYDEVVAKDLAAAKENYIPSETDAEETSEGETTTAEEITTPSETLEIKDTEAETDENGESKRVVVKEEKTLFPAENGTQVDIFLVNSIDNYNKYIAGGDIQTVAGELIGKSAIINKYINPILMKAVNVLDTPYAIPDNKVIGEYEYVLLKKDLVDKYNYNPENLNTLTSLTNFVNDVSSNESGYVPILDTYGVKPLAISMTGEESFFGAHVGYNPAQNTNAMPRNLLTFSKYQQEYSMIKSLKAAGTMKDGKLGDGTNAACIFAKGNASITENYKDDYYVSVYKYPTATNENVFNSMYAVSTYTKSLPRCMQIVTYLQTNAEFRNIFQYGVSGVNFEKDDNNFVTILNHDYVMNPEYTGNMFLMYQNNEMTEDELALSANDWELGKKQNLDAVASPYLGFSPTSTEVNFENNLSEYKRLTGEQMMSEIRKLSDSYEAKLEAYTGTGDDLIAYMNTLGEEFGEETAVKTALSNRYSNAPFARYVAWYKATYPDTTTAG